MWPPNVSRHHREAGAAGVAMAGGKPAPTARGGGAARGAAGGRAPPKWAQKNKAAAGGGGGGGGGSDAPAKVIIFVVVRLQSNSLCRAVEWLNSSGYVPGWTQLFGDPMCIRGNYGPGHQQVCNS
jgi:hypothetical protein